MNRIVGHVTPETEFILKKMQSGGINKEILGNTLPSIALKSTEHVHATKSVFIAMQVRYIA